MPTVGGAFDFLIGEGPRIFGAVGSILYVGHQSCTSPWWWERFAPAVGANRLAVIDIVQRDLNSAGSITGELYLGDIRDPGAVLGGFGLVFWDEGPEHMPRDESLETILALASRHVRVLISCPWGFQKQGDDPKDPQFHHWGPLPADFEGIGMEARTFGSMFPGGHGNLIAWTK